MEKKKFKCVSCNHIFEIEKEQKKLGGVIAKKAMNAGGFFVLAFVAYNFFALFLLCMLVFVLEDMTSGSGGQSTTSGRVRCKKCGSDNVEKAVDE